MTAPWHTIRPVADATGHPAGQESGLRDELAVRLLVAALDGWHARTAGRERLRRGRQGVDPSTPVAAVSVAWLAADGTWHDATAKLTVRQVMRLARLLGRSGPGADPGAPTPGPRGARHQPGPRRWLRLVEAGDHAA